MENEFSDFSKYLAEELTLNEETLPIVGQIADNLPGGFFIYKAYGDEKMIYINKYMLNICGCENHEQFEEMTGGSFRGFVYPEDYEKSELAIRRCIDRNENNLDYVEYRIRRYDGSIRWIMDYGRLAHTEKYGNVFCVFVDDSTDKNLRAEEDRRAAQVIKGLSEEYNSIYLIDFELKKMLPYSLNNEVSRSMQYAFSSSLDYETTIREFAEKYVIPADYDMYLGECREDSIRKRVAAEKNYSIIFRRYNEKHVLEYVQMTISGVDDDEHCNRIVMGYKNVTGKVKEAQEEARIKHTTSILRAVAEDYVCLIDVNLETEKEIQYFLNDPNNVTLPRWSEADDYSSCILDYAQKIVAQKDRKRFILATELPKLREVLSNQREFTIEYDAVLDGNVRKFQGRFTLHSEEIGAQHMYVGIRDITEAEQLRFEEQQRLIEAVARADAASSAKTTFLFNMSHDIRTPMNAIIGFSELAQKHLDDRERLTECLSNISISGNHLLNLINNVLEMSRIESGRLELDENPDDLSRATHEWSAIFTEEAEKNGLTLTSHSDIQHKAILWDCTKVEEIFLNIVSNAVKYTPAGGNIHISLKEIACEREGHARYETVVEDSGIGISEEFLPHIFESFSRERNSTESRVMGTGLGMGIVKRLIDMMGGDIKIESKPGEGTRVTVILEFRLVDEEEIKKSFTEEEQPDLMMLKGRRILLVEDNDLNREIAEELLKESGILVESAEDGIVCIDMLTRAENGYYDAILMDIQMPNMDGLTTTETIRALEDKEKATIPIIAMTANAFEEDRQKAAEAGMDGFATKPISMQQLLKELSRLLN